VKSEMASLLLSVSSENTRADGDEIVSNTESVFAWRNREGFLD